MQLRWRDTNVWGHVGFLKGWLKESSFQASGCCDKKQVPPVHLLWIWSHLRWFKKSSLKCNKVRKTCTLKSGGFGSLEIWWSMVGRCKGSITFLTWWCGGVLRHSSAVKAAWDTSSCKHPEAAALLADYQDVYFRDSLWAISSACISNSQHSQSQLQARITLVLTGLDSNDNTQ